MAKPKLTVKAQNVGLDMSMDKFDICFMIEQSDREQQIKGTKKFVNKLKGFKLLVNWMEKRRTAGIPLTITMEATGIYYEPLAYYLTSLGYHVSVLLPNKSDAYAKSLNVKTKTDKADAKTLARMGLERKLEKWEPMSKQMYIIKKLCRERVRLLKLKTMLSNQLHAEMYGFDPNPSTICRIKETKQTLNQQIKKIEKEIKQLVKQDKDLAERVDKICTTDGLGFITVINVIAENNGFAIVTKGKQLTSYAGYDVVEHQSGKSIKGKTKISKKGNSYIRRALYMPAMTASRYNEEFKNLYQRVLARTGLPMKANVAVQRKLLLLIWTLFKNNEKYDPNRWKTYGAGQKAQKQPKKGKPCLVNDSATDSVP